MAARFYFFIFLFFNLNSYSLTSDPAIFGPSNAALCGTSYPTYQNNCIKYINQFDVRQQLKYTESYNTYYVAGIDPYPNTFSNCDNDSVYTISNKIFTDTSSKGEPYFGYNYGYHAFCSKIELDLVGTRSYQADWLFIPVCLELSIDECLSKYPEGVEVACTDLHNDKLPDDALNVKCYNNKVTWDLDNQDLSVPPNFDDLESDDVDNQYNLCGANTAYSFKQLPDLTIAITNCMTGEVEVVDGYSDPDPDADNPDNPYDDITPDDSSNNGGGIDIDFSALNEALGINTTAVNDLGDKIDNFGNVIASNTSVIEALLDDDSDGEISGKINSSFDTLKNSLSAPTFSKSGATCPTWSFPSSVLLVGGLSISSHCDIIPNIRDILSGIMLVFYSVVGFRIVFSS